jgi:uncharacterized damage-inducible protein DinB
VSENLPEVWLRGPVEGVPTLLMPAAHALLQASEDLETAESLSVAELWKRPGGAASIGFHLMHIAGSIDRLLTYADGRQLSEAQREDARKEQETAQHRPPAGQLVRAARSAIDHAVEVLRKTPVEALTEKREVGRRRLPSNVLGLLFHVADHTQRHVGQIITTVRIVRGLQVTE